MIGSLYTAISGLNSNNKAMSTIGDNIANTSTYGFKSSSTLFTNMLNESLGAGGGNTPGAGVKVAGLSESWTQGSLEPTGSGTDLAISGAGFFQVREGGSAGTDLYYTRAGAFSFDADGYLTNTDGLIVQGYTLPLAAPLTTPVNIQVDSINYGNFTIEDEGIVTGVATTGANAGETVPLFQVSLFNFTNLQGLTKKGDGLYAQSTESGAPVSADGGVSGVDGLGMVLSGSLEMSNVDLATEFARMIVVQKAFQANAKVITTSDEILTALINAKR